MKSEANQDREVDQLKQQIEELQQKINQIKRD